MENIEHDADVKDNQGIMATDHLLIREVDTNEVLVNIKGSSTRWEFIE